MRLDATESSFKAGHICVRVISFEEPEVIEEARELAHRLGVTPWAWSSVRGLYSLSLESQEIIENTDNPAAALVWLARNPGLRLVILCDLAAYFTDQRVVRALRELVEQYRMSMTDSQLASRVLMIDPTPDVPPSIGFISSRCELTSPDDEEIESIIKRVLRKLNRQNKIEVKISREDFQIAIESLRGLTSRHAAQLIAQVVNEDRTFNKDDLPILLKAKRSLLRDTGVLEYIEAPESLDSIGGLVHLKAWLKKRDKSFGPAAKDFGLIAPRGVLLLGVQGAGKSLSAKAIAAAWKRPLVKLDPGTLYNKFVGESEGLLRSALQQARAMSPVVLWIDEIEKGFASAASESSDGGLSRRMFGTLLSWMQEHTSPVFLVATANDINALPPELLRKGRFDEIFFVDLPEIDARKQIFDIHLRKRKQDPTKFDLNALATASDGFSGAEIEQAILSAMYNVFGGDGSDRELSTSLIINEIAISRPLSVTMAERINDLREWAKDRCVMAG